MSADVVASPRARSTAVWGFWLYAAVALVHVGAIAAGADAVASPTKLLLMPALALAAVWALRGSARPAVAVTLLLAIALSWLGDGASTFFPFLADELPAMLACFGLAHLAYMWIFARQLRGRRVPLWALVYVVWWVAMLAILWPYLGALTAAVVAYGAVLGGTAALSTRGGAVTAIGGAFFLASDTLLAIRLFVPGDLVSGPWIMLTYTIGQGLLVYGIVRAARRDG